MEARLLLRISHLHSDACKRSCHASKPAQGQRRIGLLFASQDPITSTTSMRRHRGFADTCGGQARRTADDSGVSGDGALPAVPHRHRVRGRHMLGRGRRVSGRGTGRPVTALPPLRAFAVLPLESVCLLALAGQLAIRSSRSMFPGRIESRNEFLRVFRTIALLTNSGL
eukprot:209326-Chlamydomonas_euryale.AAC.4